MAIISLVIIIDNVFDELDNGEAHIGSRIPGAFATVQNVSRLLS